MSKPQIGSLNTTEEAGNRDAFHVPCILAVSNDELIPGMRIRFIGKYVVAAVVNHHGIVDPFIDTNLIEPGKKFWVMLNPDLVTNLVHQFTVEGVDEEVEKQKSLLLAEEVDKDEYDFERDCFRHMSGTEKDEVTIDKSELERLRGIESRFETYDDDDDSGCRECY